MDKVVIFRHQLFKVSEPFIVQQAQQLRRFEPLYLGRSRFGAAPDNGRSFSIEDDLQRRSFAQKLWQVSSRDPEPFLSALNDERPVLVHAHFGVEGVYALPLAKQLRVPLITTFHGFDATTSPTALVRSGSPSWVNYLLFRHRLAAKGDLFLCVSDYIRKRVLAMGFPAEKTHVHYMGIDTEKFQPRSPGKERRLVLHVARLVEKKGTEYLIRAFGSIAERVSDATLVIIGDGPLRPSLEALASTLGLGQRIRFMGAQAHAEVIAMMRQTAVLALPSVTAKSGDAEGLGMVLLEAAAHGVPMVATAHGGIPEVVREGTTGFLVPERDIDLLAERIQRLLDNDALRHTMGAQARAMVQTDFNIQTQTAKLETFYDMALGREPQS
ncbi:glycosyltransferase [Alcaligenaceae bacterium]|nr:glycosyltransferase [Alcaligenaceae bacterium]